MLLSYYDRQLDTKERCSFNVQYTFFKLGNLKRSKYVYVGTKENPQQPSLSTNPPPS